MNPTRRALLAAGVALPWLGTKGAFAQRARGQSVREVMRFSALKAGGALPEDLQPWAFQDQPRHTRYTLVEDAGVVVLRAQADASTSGLVRQIRVDSEAYPILAWRWKPLNLVSKSNLARKEGDDFALRVYVTFDVDLDTLSVGERIGLSLARLIYGDRVPLAALCYVWDARAPRGTFAHNPYTDRVRMIVAESGVERIGRWVSVERNIREDYRRAFGQEGRNAGPVPAVSGVIVSTDTDNTGESVEALYGDIEFRSLPAPGK